MGSVDFSKKAFILVTGASQGIGQTIAVEVAKLVANNSVMVLIARSADGLNVTKKTICEINDSIFVKTVPLDLSCSTIENYKHIFDNLELENVGTSIIVHNAGQIGVLNEALELTDIATWRNYYDLNMFSVVILNSVCIKQLRGISTNMFIVNITSLCGSKPFKNMAMYGSGKAARDLYFKVLAEEEKHITVLNYSPGPVDTAMVAEIIENIRDPEMKSSFVGLKQNETILTTLQTVTKLIDVLKKGNYVSGEKIDYFDD